jgi:hypothetical protein
MMSGFIPATILIVWLPGSSRMPPARKGALTMAQTAETGLTQACLTDHAWIATELEKGMEAERTLSSEAKAKGDSPPEPALAVLYHEIAAADERHVAVIELIATRYGRTPASPTGGIGQALGLIKDQFAKIGSSPLDQLSGDLTAKGRSIHWLTAWVHAFEAIGDTASARELSVALTDEEAHRDALQQGFNRMVEQLARGSHEAQNSLPNPGKPDKP